MSREESPDASLIRPPSSGKAFAKAATVFGFSSSARDMEMVAISSEVCGINEIMPNRDETKDIYPNEREIVTIDNNLEVARCKQ